MFSLFQNSLDSLTFEQFWNDNIKPNCFAYIKICFQCLSISSNENFNLIKQALEDSITPCLAFFDVYSDSFLIVTLVQAMGGIFLGLQHISTLNVLTPSFNPSTVWPGPIWIKVIFFLDFYYHSIWASKYIPKRPRICIIWNHPFQTQIYLLEVHCIT